MTPKQKENYNHMLRILKKIAKGYGTPQWIAKNAEKQWGLSEHEALEMAYENIQQDAKDASKGVRPVK